MILGIDVGTTAVKAVLLDDAARVVGEGTRPHDLHSPRLGWAEEDPESWWMGVVGACRDALSGHALESLRGIGVSGMVPAIVLLDDQGHVIRPAIQQNDARAFQEIHELRAHFPTESLFQAAGASWNQQVVGPKLLWIRRNEPAAWQRIRHIIGSYEYVTRRITGVTYCEANWALESGLWDERRSRWIREIIDRIGLDETWLPAVRRSDECIGEVSKEAAAETGIPEGVPVIAGSADHIASALAAGAIESGQAVVKLGGAGDLLLAIDTFRPVKDLFIDHHCIPGMYVVNGCMATSGSVLKWFAQQCAGNRSFTELDREAEAIPAGCEGLVTLPYFLGEKTPIHDPLARGTLVGLTLTHRTAHIYRSILEGVAFAFRHHFDVLSSSGLEISDVSVVDGGARSDLWCKILATVLERPVLRPKSAHVGSALGVALATGASLGDWKWDVVGRTPKANEVFRPDAKAQKTYRRLYDVYRRAYERLRTLFPLLSET